MAIMAIMAAIVIMATMASQFHLLNSKSLKNPVLQKIMYGNVKYI